MSDSKINSLPVNLTLIFDFYDWGRLTFTKAKEIGIEPDTSKDGYTLTELVNGEWMYSVVYNSSLIPQRIRWTLSHEIGHIILGHAREAKDGKSENEEAQYFAEQLLSPIAVVAKLGAKNGDEIMKMCNISNKATGWRAPDLQRHFWYREKYGYTADDKAFLRQFGLL